MTMERSAGLQTHGGAELCVFGVGGVGGYFGGKIACRLNAPDGPAWRVHFVARGENLTAIQRSGLRLETNGARLTCAPASVAADMRDLPVPDVVLVCVKSYSLDAALEQIAAHRREDTVIVPLLNGVDIHARIRAHLPSGPVLPACALVGTHLERPGVVAQAGGDGVILLGSDPDHPDFVPEPFLSLLTAAGVPYRWFDDPRPALWEKYLFIAAFGLVTAASGKSVGEVLADPVLLEDARGIMDEVAGLAAQEGVALGRNAVRDALAKARGFPFATRTSLQRDVESGRRDEGDLFGGTILRLGSRHEVSTAVTKRVYAGMLARRGSV
jgi:2-dehydropantoate 2-reductase